MLVSEKHKRLVMNLKDPGRVSSLVPGCATLQYKGRDLLVVPHTQDAAMALRGVGMTVPGPIRHYYDWPGRTPYSHQVTTAEFLSMNMRAFCLNGMGSGKTLSVLWAFDYLHALGMVDRLVVFSPLSTLVRTWADEILRNFPRLDASVMHGTAAKRRTAHETMNNVLLINHDGVRSPDVFNAVASMDERTLIVVDEVASFRNTSTAKWKALNRIINGHAKTGVARKPWAWGLTGTPLPNDPTDAYGQCKLIVPTSTPQFFGAFREQVMFRRGPFEWVPKPDALATVSRAMQPSIRFSREECIELPPTTYIDRDVPMTPEQSRLYADMLSRMKTEYEGGKLDAINKAVLVNKLLQICLGTAYGKDGNITIPAGPRVQETLELIEQSEGKVIVFAPLTGAVHALAKVIGERYPTAVITGETPAAERNRIFGDFQNDRHLHVIVANPGTMSHGLTLTAASTIVWFGPASAEIYQQANMRIVRPGQKRNTLIARLISSRIEEKRYANLDGRGAQQDLFLEAVSEAALF